MFIPVRRDIWRWGTPDPEGDWIMYGHLLLKDGKCILVDPPLVPDFMKSVERLGKPEAIILTTLDHTRGSKYLSTKYGMKLYIPDEEPSFAFDPDEILRQKEITGYTKYGKDSIYGLKPLRIKIERTGEDQKPYMDEYALLTENRELLTGDIAIGTEDKGILVAPEWFPHDPPYEPHLPAREEFVKVVMESGADTMLASHGCNVYGKLREMVGKLR